MRYAMASLRCVPQSMQGVHRVIQSLFLFDVVSGHVKNSRALTTSASSARVMRSGSLVLSTSKSAALYKSLHAPLSGDLELPLVIVPLFHLAGRSESVSNSPECFRRNGLQHRLQFRYDGAGDPYWELTRVRHCSRA